MKSFIAPDMRTAVRLVREEFGDDPVILSKRRVPPGIELVASADMPPPPEPRAERPAPAQAAAAHPFEYDPAPPEPRAADPAHGQMQQDPRPMAHVMAEQYNQF